MSRLKEYADYMEEFRRKQVDLLHSYMHGLWYARIHDNPQRWRGYLNTEKGAYHPDKVIEFTPVGAEGNMVLASVPERDRDEDRTTFVSNYRQGVVHHYQPGVGHSSYGWTTDLNAAQRFTEDEAKRVCSEFFVGENVVPMSVVEMYKHAKLHVDLGVVRAALERVGTAK